mmetsp:Transcript_81491/g.189263  ORF Transcript_81491/g.189263 Transcript_81491/m.189263 type:complete len:115 (+) Transcript_81491:567-911(+)
MPPLSQKPRRALEGSPVSCSGTGCCLQRQAGTVALAGLCTAAWCWWGSRSEEGGAAGSSTEPPPEGSAEAADGWGLGSLFGGGAEEDGSSSSVDSEVKDSGAEEEGVEGGCKQQ